MIYGFFLHSLYLESIVLSLQYYCERFAVVLPSACSHTVLTMQRYCISYTPMLHSVAARLVGSLLSLSNLAAMALRQLSALRQQPLPAKQQA